jgi:hypothetical protein
MTGHASRFAFSGDHMAAPPGRVNEYRVRVYPTGYPATTGRIVFDSILASDGAEAKTKALSMLAPDLGISIVHADCTGQFRLLTADEIRNSNTLEAQLAARSAMTARD